MKRWENIQTFEMAILGLFLLIKVRILRNMLRCLGSFFQFAIILNSLTTKESGVIMIKREVTVKTLLVCFGLMDIFISPPDIYDGSGQPT